MGTVPAVDPYDVGISGDRFAVCGWSAELLGPVGSEPLGVARMNSTFKGMSQDRIVQATPVPSLSERQQSVRSAHGVEDVGLHATTMIDDQ